MRASRPRFNCATKAAFNVTAPTQVDTDGGARRQGNTQGHGNYRRRLIFARQVTDSHMHQALAAFLQHQVLKDKTARHGAAWRGLASGSPVFEDLAVLGIGLQGSRHR